MAQISKLYTFAALCVGMAAGSTGVNKIMKPDMTIPQRQVQSPPPPPQQQQQQQQAQEAK